MTDTERIRRFWIRWIVEEETRLVRAWNQYIVDSRAPEGPRCYMREGRINALARMYEYVKSMGWHLDRSLAVGEWAPRPE